MEVHHHPHVEKKSFKEYLLEGLMIFLAVSMGFIAENIREKIVEHEIEKRSIELVVSNLKEDTAALNMMIKKNTKQVIAIDSLLRLRDKSLKDSNTVKTFYSLFYRCVFVFPFLSNSSAFQQMKNSGSLRLVNGKQILDSLFKYDYWNKTLVSNADQIALYINKVIDEAGNFLVFDNRHASVINIDQKADAINRFYEYFFAVEVILSTNYVRQLAIQQEGAKRLIKKLQDEYHLEKE